MARALLDEGGCLRRVEPLKRVIRRNREDIFKTPGRLLAADVHARGSSIASDRLGRAAGRALDIIGVLAEIDRERAHYLLAMAAAGAVSALSYLERELKLTISELKSVLKGEAAAIERDYPRFAGALWRAIREDRDSHLFGRALTDLWRKSTTQGLASSMPAPFAPVDRRRDADNASGKAPVLAPPPPVFAPLPSRPTGRSGRRRTPSTVRAVAATRAMASVTVLRQATA